MSTEIQIFNNPEFGEIRTVVNANNEPIFCLVDLCEVLELTPSKVSQRLAEDVLSKYPLQTAGGIQQANFVNEDGLYDVILDSRKPEARKFRKWITGEVLPSIRKTGGYGISLKKQKDDAVIAEAMIILQKRLFVAEEHFKALELEKVPVEVATKPNTIPIPNHPARTYTSTQVGAEIGLSAFTLNKKLHALGVHYPMCKKWFIYAHHVNKGLALKRGTGKSSYLVWTEKGRQFILDLFKDEKL